MAVTRERGKEPKREVRFAAARSVVAWRTLALASEVRDEGKTLPFVKIGRWRASGARAEGT